VRLLEAGSGPELLEGPLWRPFGTKKLLTALRCNQEPLAFPQFGWPPATPASPIALLAFFIKIRPGAVKHEDGTKRVAKPGQPRFFSAILLTSETKILYLKNWQNGGSSNGRTADSGSAYPGSNPGPPATFFRRTSQTWLLFSSRFSPRCAPQAKGSPGGTCQVGPWFSLR
jgi:hypothetical protein